MRRKRIWYSMGAPDGLWWVNGLVLPVPPCHPLARKKGYSDYRTVRTMRKALRIVRAVPGCEFARFMTVRGKHYELCRWVPSAK